ncbi:uncharacterized protein N0V89_000268 [Didymosphaeria variabile]|uniref:Uncharacterized protein n=1 Tax=Didymosphaeria variabile TaxID=1932322 RepID=A0A9W8XWF9_9PLEO|nr:uncharacterized protein N0V89_000268 [Didymosphaeria variabile]KAJ4359712.1 hypothetical protein N0V89_000268 [Didymosphaeria variabile]
MAPPANAVLLQELKVFTGTFSWSPNILRHNIELALPGYKSYDPATWPRISGDIIRRFDGSPYDGSRALPAAGAAFDEDVMELFLGNVAKDWAFDTSELTRNQRKPDSTIRKGFKDFPFIFTYDGNRKRRARWCWMPPCVRSAYVKLLGPGASASTNQIQPSRVAHSAASSDRQPQPPLVNPLFAGSGPSRPASLAPKPQVRDTEQTLIGSGSHELPKSSEAAYQEMLGMLEDQHLEIKEPHNMQAAVAQEIPRAEEAEAVSKAAYQQCESAVKELTELAGLGFLALRTELDGKVKGFDDKARKLEQRAITAEKRNDVLEQNLESCKRRVQDLELQLNSRDAELAAAKAEATQADERLMKLWAAMEKSRDSISRKRKEVNEPPALMEAGESRNTKRARKVQQPSVESDHDDDESDELEDGEIRQVSPPIVKTELLVRHAILEQAVEGLLN